MSSTIIAITGGRYESDSRIIRVPTPTQIEKFHSLWTKLNGNLLVHGNAIGIDRQISSLVKKWGFRVIPYPIDPKLDGPFPAAGQIRNRRMLVNSQAKYLIGFPGNRGTKGCLAIGIKLGLIVYRWDGEDFSLDLSTPTRYNGGCPRVGSGPLRERTIV